MGKVVVIVVVSGVLAACGGGGSDAASPRGTDAEGSSRREVTPVALEQGQLLLPDPGDPVLEGYEISLARDPSLRPERQHAGPEDYASGWLQLYGDGSADDPFDAPWVLAVAQTINYDASLDAELIAGGDELDWALAEPDMDNPEAPAFGVLTSGLGDAAQRLVDAAGRTLDEHGGVRIELPESVRAGEEPPLELLAAGPVDTAGLGRTSWSIDGVPIVEWGDDGTRFSVQSFAEEPGVGLLLRAALGGERTGPAVVPISHPPDDDLLTVRAVDGSTVLVQSNGLDPDQLDAVADALRPTGAERLRQLAVAYNLAFSPSFPDGPDELATGDALGGRWYVALQLDPADSVLGPTEACQLAPALQFPEGRSVGGGMFGGLCQLEGFVGATPVDDPPAVFIHGYLPPDAARIEVVAVDGTVHEPELVGERWKVFGLVLPDVDRASAARTYAADGRLLVDLLDPDRSTEQLERLAENWPKGPDGEPLPLG